MFYSFLCMTHQWVNILQYCVSRSYLCTWSVCLVRTWILVSWCRQMDTRRPNFLVRVRYCGMMRHPVRIYQLNFVPSYHLIPVHFLNRAIMVYYYILHLFPVSASSISLHRCRCICILSCGCVGVSVRRYCCGFWYKSLKNRLSNSKLHY